MLLVLALLSLPSAAADGGEPDLPPHGHSRFDELIGAGPVPFPFTSVLRRIEHQLVTEPGGLAPLKGLQIPLGRSLQRGAGAPDFFRFPRLVVAVDGATRPGVAPMRDRLFIGYHEKGAVLEVISYNEALGRFEYQLVRDYRPGGKADLVYARRALCLACHQNAAPIFARPLWEETPANPAIAKRLRATGRDFYGIPIGGTDIAYFFDNATDRANLLPVWQRIWREGCGDGAGGAACRQELFAAALRLALSGRLPEQKTLAALAPRLDRRWRQVWPDGLIIPNPDLPNRDPLARQMGPATRSAPPLPEVLAGLPHGSFPAIPARFEPLNPRPPLEIWPAPDKARLLAGLAGLFADADLDALDRVLAGHAGKTERLSLNCRLRVKTGGRHTFDCQGDQVRLVGATWHVRDGHVRGRLDQLSLPGAPAGISLEQVASSVFLPRHGHRSARLADGRRLAEISIRQGGSGLILVDDFAQVTIDLPSLRARTTFPAWTGMAELLTALGTKPTRAAALPLPPPRGEQTVAEAAGPVGAFRRRCGQCHDTPEAAPPNFLHGDANVVSANLARCAPRIYYRLSMWEIAETQRGKTPMPPPTALAGLDTATWIASPERRQLLDHARGLLKAQGVDPAAITRRSFESLPACLPEKRQRQEGVEQVLHFAKGRSSGGILEATGQGHAARSPPAPLWKREELAALEPAGIFRGRQP